MKLLVTGAGGFVGRALLPRLQRDGHVAVTPSRADLGGSIGPGTDWARWLEGAEAVVHLANRAHDHGAAESEIRRINVEGSARLAEQAKAAGVRRFVFVSSVKAMAETSGDRVLAESDPAHPGSVYGRAKLDAEHAVQAVFSDAVLLRPPLVYGPEVGANFRRLLALASSPLPLPLGAVRNRRSLLFRDNLADAIALTLQTPGLSGAYLLQDDAPVSTAELLRRLRVLLVRSPMLLPVPPVALRLVAKLVGRAEMAESLLGSLAVDDSRFRRASGWTPPATMQQGLAATVAWWNERNRRAP